MNDKVIETKGLTKRFGSFTAVDHISFEVGRGEIFGFLGANGAGKTTAMRMLCGLSRPTEGGGTVAGFDIVRQSEQIKRNIGYMSQRFSLYEDLKVWENIRLFGSDLPRAAHRLPRRADRRGRSGYAAAVLEADLRRVGTGHHGFRHDALHGRGGVLQPRLDHGRRGDPGAGYSGQPETNFRRAEYGRGVPSPRPRS